VIGRFDELTERRPLVALLVVGPVCGVLVVTVAGLVGFVEIDGVTDLLWAAITPGVLPFGALLALVGYGERRWKEEVRAFRRRGPSDREPPT
jgi:hypothetical protein